MFYTVVVNFLYKKQEKKHKKENDTKNKKKVDKTNRKVEEYEFYYTQEDYQNGADLLDLSETRCACGAKGDFTIHGHYDRYLQCDSEDTILTITRVRCLSCGRTHALLPIIIIPYLIISNPIVTKVIATFRKEDIKVSTISKLYHLPYVVVKKLIDYYKGEHKQRLESVEATLSYTSLLSKEFITRYIQENSLLFMQNSPCKHPVIMCTT